VSGPCILVADDDETDVFFMRRALKEAGPGVPVFDVGDGREAIGYLSGAGKYADRTAFPLPAVLVLDIKLPLQCGWDILAWLQEHPELTPPCVVVMSGSKLLADKQRAEALGAEYHVKPLELADLAELARAICRKAGLA
jgi:CheY-like chemotaxis protein